MNYIVGYELAEIFLKEGFKEVPQKTGKQRFRKNGVTVFFDYANIQILTRADYYDCDCAISENQLQAVLHLSESYNRRDAYSSLEEAINSVSMKYTS